ncbi:KH domain-containing protein [Candidatus Saccharibacteria bacterium]|nr:KH domain-containing protein [Candidatus Saccharibacteria bacterium]
MDQQFIEYIVKSLVNNPDAVEIKRTIDEKGVLLELTVDVEDLGRVIGKRGATAQSLRTLLRALGTKNDARYNLKIVDVGGPPPHRQPRDDTAASSDEDTSKKVADDLAADDDIIEEEKVEEVVAKDEPSDVVSRTRAELADLDDLDV